MDRQKLNREIIEQIVKYNEEYPFMRFQQILANLNISVCRPEFEPDGRPTGKMICEDLYHEEPSKTLERMKILNS